MKQNFNFRFRFISFISLRVNLFVCLTLLTHTAHPKTIQVPHQQLTIQAAIDLSTDGETVLVADGTYTGSGNVNLDFKGKSITLKSANGAESCIIDCQKNSSSRGFLFQNKEGQDSVLSGFTIRNGNVVNENGGGIYCVSASPTIISCILIQNVAAAGGGVFCLNSDAMISNCLVLNNQAKGGGGIQAHEGTPTITGCQITNNKAETGGGLFATQASVVITNTVISGNKADYGGGILCWSDSLMFLNNNTITGNQAMFGGGIFCSNSDLLLVNSILYQNVESIDNTAQQMYFGKSAQPIVADISYSLIQGGKAAVITDETVTLKWGTGNITADPKFVAPTTGDYRLQDESPAIGGGIKDESMPTVDIEGHDRPFPDQTQPDLEAYEHRRGQRHGIEPIETETYPDVLINSNKGQIRLTLYPQFAPLTVKNFYKLIRQQFYDGLTFHRYVPLFVIQGGCPLGNGTGGPGWTVEGEFQDPKLKAKMPKHTRGVLAMARSTHPDSAGSQFYICLADAPHLDGDYTAFGRVIGEGMTVVDKLRQGDKMLSVQLMEENVQVLVPTQMTITPQKNDLPADGKSITPIEITILDQNGNGLANQKIELETSLGYVSLVEDHENGTYTVTYTAGTEKGQENLIVTTDGPIGMGLIRLTEPMRPMQMTVVATDRSLPADGQSTTRVEITILDQMNKGLSGQQIDMSTTIGTLTELIDHGNGTYIATYTSGTEIGVAQLRLKTDNEQLGQSTIRLVEPTVLAKGGFEVNIDNPVQSVQIGDQPQTKITVLGKDGFSDTIFLFLAGLPKGISAQIQPPSIEISEKNNQANATLRLTITPDAETSGQAFILLATGSDTGQTRRKQMTIVVSPSTKPFVLIDLKMTPTNPSVGQSVLISAQLIMQPITPIVSPVPKLDKLPLKLLLFNPAKQSIKHQVQTDSEGKIQLRQLVDQSGRWRVSAHFEGVNQIKPIIQETMFLSKSSATHLNWTTPKEINLGQQIKIGGYLSLKGIPQTGVANQWVNLAIFLPESSETISFQTQTDEDGYFEQPIVADQVGIWELTADWQGNKDYQKSNNHHQLSVILPTKSPHLIGDANRDGIVDIFDLVKVASQFGLTGSDLVGDLNNDHLINIFDLVLVASNFGRLLASASHQPNLNLTNEQTDRLIDAIEWLQKKADLSTVEADVLELLIPMTFHQTPDSTQLFTNYPNPFNPETWIPFQLSRDVAVTITIYNIEGHLIRRLDLGWQSAGRYLNQKQAVFWDGQTETGESVGSGTYFYQLQADNYIGIRKMVILR